MGDAAGNNELLSYQLKHAGSVSGFYMLQAMFECHTVSSYKGGQEKISLEAVKSATSENAEWSTYTPSGTLEMVITNPLASGKIKPGDQVLLTLSVVENH